MSRFRFADRRPSGESRYQNAGQEKQCDTGPDPRQRPPKTGEEWWRRCQFLFHGGHNSSLCVGGERAGLGIPAETIGQGLFGSLKLPNGVAAKLALLKVLFGFSLLAVGQRPVHVFRIIAPGVCRSSSLFFLLCARRSKKVQFTG